MGQWQGVGLDINKRALTVARRQGVHGICGAAGRLGVPSHAFDVVTAWDVIEHVPDPVLTMAEIYRVLKPGGSLLLSTPNSEACQVRLWGRHWAGWDVPRHLQVFSYRTLYRLLERTHFVVTQRLSFPTERFYAVESARRYLDANQGGVTGTILKHLASFFGIAAWPIWRWMDQTEVASSIVLEVRAIKNALS
jgi:SAM-dependent methyltransferase